MALDGKALGVQQTHDREWNVLHAHDLADWTFFAKELSCRSLAHDGELAGAAHVGVTEGFPFSQRPLANVKVLGRFTVNLGLPVLVASSDLSGGKIGRASCRERVESAE